MVYLNDKGQVFFFALMLGVVIIILALAFAPVLKSFNDEARNVSSDTRVGLDCGNQSISDFNKAQCTIQDISLPYFIIGVIALGGIVLTAKTFLGA